MQVDVDLDQEIEALERELFGTPGEDPIEETLDLEPPELNEPTEVIVKEEVKEEVKGPTVDEVQKRFNNYKASTDITIRDLRSDLAASKMKYATLQKSYSELSQRLVKLEATDSKKIFSEEEIDILGEPAANALDKGVRDILEAKLRPLQEEVAKAKQAEAERELREAQQLIKRDYDDFIVKLARAVPDYESLNVSPGFLQYMKEADEFSGVPREHLFMKAEQALDVGRIVSFFNDYKKTIKTPDDNTSILESAVTPTGKPGITTDPGDSKEPVITYAFIDQYYDDFNRGKYKSKAGREKALKIEAMIDRAVLSGNVR